MGRKKLNKTQDELREQKRIRDKRYYEKHKSKLLQKRMRRYWEKMDKKMSNFRNPLISLRKNKKL